MYCSASEPSAGESIRNAFRARAEEIRRFAPEVIFAFGPDHYTSMFHKLAPPFCVGVRAEAVGDIGGHEGTLQVPTELAMQCIEAIRMEGVDVAVSHDLKIDHGISQTLFRVASGLSTYPTIPVAINIFTAPLPPFRRGRALGEAIGNFVARKGLRALFLGSGGLSHNPKPIFPAVGEGGDLVDYHMKEGPGGDTDREKQWLQRQYDIHVAAAKMLADGRLTATDCMFNPELDRECMRLFVSGDLQVFDDWNPTELISKAGIGSVELQCWIAACSAQRAAGGPDPTIDIYEPVVEYGVAVGMIHA
jgi:2,3-dihydroxyphenylpropionate 1,2-dioxygenase